MYERDGTQGDWNDLNEPIVPANQVDIGKHYKCVFNDNDGTSTDSLIMRMVEGKTIILSIMYRHVGTHYIDELCKSILASIF